ncbi:hypothetical protein MRS44_017229 [Fusarium solani]|nr:hypothetical protein MRS44_017229 [Fusarium solani]
MPGQTDQLRARKAIAAAHSNASRFTRTARGITKSTPHRTGSLRDIASKASCSKSLVGKVLSSSSSPLETRQRGRPPTLTPVEEAGLVSYIVWLERSGFPADKRQVEEAAREIRARRGLDNVDFSKHWYRRFRERHLELKKSFIKAVDKSRKSFEASDIEDVKTYFENLQHIILNYRIGPSEIWNEDECGIRLGCLAERTEVLVTRTTRSQRPEIVDPNNRESMTLIGAGNAVGDSIPPWLIFKSFPSESWAEIDCIPGMRFAKSESGFSNKEISLEWLREFNRWSWKHSAQAQAREVSLGDYFGCDEWMRDPYIPHLQHEKPPKTHPEEEKIYRLLVIDGFSGHTNFDFVMYCIQFDIIFCTLPPHSTHILQPLDLGVFQPLKNAHQKRLRASIRAGNLAFDRVSFVKAFTDFYVEGFSPHNIMSGFEKGGIWPPTEEPAVKRLLAKKVKNREAIDPKYLHLLPKDQRFQEAEDQLDRIIERYHEVMSSPSREALRSAKKVVSEALHMDQQRQAFVSNMETRIKAISAKKKPGKFIKPIGNFITSVDAEDIRKQHEEEVVAEAARQNRREVRHIRSMCKQEIDRLTTAWREERIRLFGTTRTKKMPFKQWLVDSGRQQEFLSLDCNHKKMNEILNTKPDGFMIDIPEAEEVRLAREKACLAPRPILAMNWQGSDDTVTFTCFGPFNDEDDEELPPVTAAAEDDDLCDTQLEEIPRYERSSPPIELGTPCPTQESESQAEMPSLPPLPPPPQRLPLWKQIDTMLEPWRVEKGSRAGPAGQDHI